MRYEEVKRALICYAGSAPEASIGSKPVGSELKSLIGRKDLISQEFSTSREMPSRHAGHTRKPQLIDIYPFFSALNQAGRP